MLIYDDNDKNVFFTFLLFYFMLKFFMYLVIFFKCIEAFDEQELGVEKFACYNDAKPLKDHVRLDKRCKKSVTCHHYNVSWDNETIYLLCIYYISVIAIISTCKC